jgi:hypothetical protein
MVTLTRSSSEAEFVAASQSTGRVEAHGAVSVTESEQKGPTWVWEDIMMSENSVNSKRSRHIDTQEHFIRDLVKDDIIKHTGNECC